MHSEEHTACFNCLIWREMNDCYKQLGLLSDFERFEGSTQCVVFRPLHLVTARPQKMKCEMQEGC